MNRSSVAAIFASAYTGLAINMRYRVRGLEIRSENAAKPGSSAGCWMLDFISSLEPRHTALDLGCGKLRYTVPLAQRLRFVTAVDSEVQLNRSQMLFGTRCSVREYVRNHLPNVRVFELEDNIWKRNRYNVVLCANVVSAIPFLKIRRELLNAAFNCLKAGGQFLVTTQYRNSHFTNWGEDARAERFYDGFLVQSDRGTSFYGLINSARLSRLCKSAGFAVLEAGHANELAYVSATRT